MVDLLIAVFAVGAPLPPVGDPAEAPLPATTVGFGPRLAVLAGEAADFNPRFGYGFVVSARHRLLRQGRLAAGGEAEIAYQHFSREITVEEPASPQEPLPAPPQEPPAPPQEPLRAPRTQLLNHTTFGVAPSLSATFGRLELWGAGGGGLAISHFLRPAFLVEDNEERRGAVPFVYAAGGVDLTVSGRLSMGLRVAYRWLFSSDRVAEGRPFTDLTDLGVDAGYSF
jgi:hypothetical protein